MRISPAFVRRWAGDYDKRYEEKLDAQTENELKEWLRSLPEPKHLDKEHFVRLACWKTPRPVHAYQRNEPTLVKETTTLAYLTQNEILKLHILTALKGVSVPVAATILHFFHPKRFPIFDVRARKTLQKAGLWSHGSGDSSIEAWQAYVRIMRQLAKRLQVTLRELDKALYAYDKWGSE